jgi:hypothetical protein
MTHPLFRKRKHLSYRDQILTIFSACQNNKWLVFAHQPLGFLYFYIKGCKGIIC